MRKDLCVVLCCRLVQPRNAWEFCFGPKIRFSYDIELGNFVNSKKNLKAIARNRGMLLSIRLTDVV